MNQETRELVHNNDMFHVLMAILASIIIATQLYTHIEVEENRRYIKKQTQILELLANLVVGE